MNHLIVRSVHSADTNSRTVYKCSFILKTDQLCVLVIINIHTFFRSTNKLGIYHVYRKKYHYRENNIIKVTLNHHVTKINDTVL